MIDRTHLEGRIKALSEQREAQRHRLIEYQGALRATEQLCQQLDGAIAVLQDVLAQEEIPCPASAPDSNGSSAQS